MTPLILVFLTGLVLLPLATLPAVSGKAGARLIAQGVLVLSLQALAVVAFVIDSKSGFSASWLYCVLFILMAVAVSSAVYLQYRCKSVVGLASAFCAVMLVLHFAELSPGKALLNLHREVQPDMSASEVRAAVERHSARTRLDVSDDFASVAQKGNRTLFITDNLKLVDRRLGFIEINFSDGRVIDKHSHLLPINELIYPQLLAILIGLGFVLSRRALARIRVQPAPVRPTPAPGRGIEVAEVAEQLRSVRQNYLAAFPPLRHLKGWRKNLVASTANHIREMPFFHDRPKDESEGT